MSIQRSVGAAAVLAAIGTVVVLAAPGSTPDAAAGGAEVAEWYADHREAVLAQFVVGGLSWCLVMPALFIALHRRLGEAGGLAASIGLAGAVIESAAIGVIVLLGGVLAFASPGVEPGTARVLYDGYLLAFAMSAFPTILCALGFARAIAQSDAIPRWTAWGGVVVAAAHAGAAVSIAHEGALAATGPFAEIAPLAMTVWLGGLGLVLVRPRAGRRGVAAAAAAALLLALPAAASASPKRAAGGDWQQIVSAAPTSYDPLTGAAVFDGSTMWRGTFTGITHYTARGQLDPITGDFHGTLRETFAGRAPNGARGTLEFDETIDAIASMVKIDARIVDGSRGFAGADGRLRFEGTANAATGGGTYSGWWRL